MMGPAPIQMAVADKTKVLRRVLVQHSSKDWRWICKQGTRTIWCKLGLLIAKRELDMTWREAGACFDLSSGQASGAVQKLEERMCEDEELADLMFNLSDQVLSQMGQT
jgi:hypothetical protein